MEGCQVSADHGERRWASPLSGGSGHPPPLPASGVSAGGFPHGPGELHDGDLVTLRVTEPADDGPCAGDRVDGGTWGPGAAVTHLQGGSHVLQQLRCLGLRLPVPLEQVVLPGSLDDLGAEEGSGVSWAVPSARAEGDPEPREAGGPAATGGIRERGSPSPFRARSARAHPPAPPPLGLLTCTRVFNSIKAGEHKAPSAYTAIQVRGGRGGVVWGWGRSNSVHRAELAEPTWVY